MVHIRSAVLSPDGVDNPPETTSVDLPPGRAGASVLNKPLKVSINPNLINKNELGDTSLFARGWVNRELTPHQLAGEIDRGVAYCCQLNGARRASNFSCSDVLSVDIDGTRRIEEVMTDPLVERCLTILYTTPSHTPENHRFRLVFALPRTITIATEKAAASRSLTLRLGGDPSATDAARLSYGSKGSNPQVFDRSIDGALLDELIAQGMDADQSDTKGAKGALATTVSRHGVAADQIILTGDGKQLRFDEIETGRSVCCPFHHDVNASAFVLRSRLGAKGFHCSTCAQTFWLAGSSLPPYNFFEFEECVRKADAYFEKHQDPGPLRELFPSEHPIHLGLTKANISITSREYLHIDKLADGITFVKSPKGTGKTERLRSLLQDGSILLIGHRIALIRQSCKRLGLECYLDIDGPLDRDRVGVCLDSLHRLQTKLLRFDTVIIDESEQVLSHFLSDTIPSEKRDAIFVIFRSLLRRAKRVVALDADLSWLTFETLMKLSNDWQRLPNVPQMNDHRDSYIYLNDRPTQKAIEVYESDHHLLAEMKQYLSDGKRVFVTSNSKRRIDAIEAAVAIEIGGIRMIKITSDTVGSEVVKAFIADPKVAALRYDLMLTSPSLGTGVDIAFEDRQQLIDAVFGFFEAKINTHFDIDQQLARVRQPGAVKVWISPRTFRFDTALDVVKADIRQAGVYKNFLDKFDERDMPVYIQDDPFLDLAASVVSQQRASKNNLKQHFVELKKRQGFAVESVPVAEDMREEGRGLAKLGRELSDQKRVDILMQANPLRKSQHEDLEGRFSENDEVTESEKWSMRRTSIERFYRAPICPQLIKLDDFGKMRARVVRFENLLKLVPDLVGRERFIPRMRFVKTDRDVIEVLYRLLHATPLMKDGKWIHATLTAQDLVPFARAMKKDKAIVENVLDIEVRADVLTKPVRQLNVVLGLVGMRCKPLKKRKQAGWMIYPYALDANAYERVTALVEKRATTDSWEAVYDMHGWDKAELKDEDADMDWDELERVWKSRRSPVKDAADAGTQAIAA